MEGSALLEPVDGNGSPARAAVEASGIHFDTVYAGRYHLQLQVNNGFAHTMYLDSVRLGERDITVEAFEVVPGIPPFRVVLKTGGGRVRGTVKDGIGGIAVLVPRDERPRVHMALSFFTADYFEVDNLRPGDYHAFATSGTFNRGQMRDPSYARALLAGAPAVRVEENGTATVAFHQAVALHLAHVIAELGEGVLPRREAQAGGWIRESARSANRPAGCRRGATLPGVA